MTPEEKKKAFEFVEALELMMRNLRSAIDTGDLDGVWQELHEIREFASTAGDDWQEVANG